MKKQSFEEKVASRATSKVFSELAYRDMDHTISEFALDTILTPMQSMDSEEREAYAKELLPLLESSMSENKLIKEVRLILIKLYGKNIT